MLLIRKLIPLRIKILLEGVYLNARNRLRGYKDICDFPFDVNQPLGPDAPRVMAVCCRILERLNVDYYVCDGTALGLVRQGAFIPHDNDIDVCVLNELDVSGVKQAFLAEGFKIGREVSYRNALQQIIFYSAEHVIFDICVWRKGAGPYAYLYVPEVPNGRRQNISAFQGRDMLEFNGRKYPTHPDIRKWLREHYGEDWQTPRQSRGDWRDEVQDIIV